MYTHVTFWVQLVLRYFWRSWWLCQNVVTLQFNWWIVAGRDFWPPYCWHFWLLAMVSSRAFETMFGHDCDCRTNALSITSTYSIPSAWRDLSPTQPRPRLHHGPGERRDCHVYQSWTNNDNKFWVQKDISTSILTYMCSLIVLQTNNRVNLGLTSHCHPHHTLNLLSKRWDVAPQ